MARSVGSRLLGLDALLNLQSESILGQFAWMLGQQPARLRGRAYALGCLNGWGRADTCRMASWPPYRVDNQGARPTTDHGSWP